MKYICFYDTFTKKEENRASFSAAQAKIDYIISAINSNNIPVEVISASNTLNLKGKVKGRKEKISQNEYTFFPSFGCKNKILRFIRNFVFKNKIKNYLRKNVKKGETVLIYHSYGYMWIYKYLKKMKKVKLIIEVEELYGDLLENKKLTKKEIQFLNYADQYIFCTELLNEKINSSQKPYAICYGSYTLPELYNDKFNDGKIHCVYSGNFDVRKKGIVLAIETARYLDERYKVHILGFGTDDEIHEVKEKIFAINAEKGYEIISFEGYKTGAEFNSFLQKCDFALSTQTPFGAYCDTSFPSKVLVYLSNQLPVLSYPIKVIINSKVKPFMILYDEDKGESVAKKIKEATSFEQRKQEIREFVHELDKEFCKSIKELIC